MMQEYAVQVQFITYGDECDREWEEELQGIKLLPVYERLQRPKSKILALLQTLLIPWFFRQELRETDLFKTNQIWGCWLAVLSKWFFHKPLLVRCGYEAYKNSLEAYSWIDLFLNTGSSQNHAAHKFRHKSWDILNCH